MTTQEQQGILGQISRIREQANLLIEQELRNCDIEGILPAHGSILIYLFSQDKAVPMKQIVEKVGRVKSTVTGMIKTLEQYGYVEKFQSAEDGRIMLVQLTDKGRTLKSPMKDISTSLIKKVYGDMPESNRETLTALLQQVRSNLET